MKLAHICRNLSHKFSAPISRAECVKGSPSNSLLSHAGRHFSSDSNAAPKMIKSKPYKRGNTRSILLTGKTGSGKSRLESPCQREFVHRACVTSREQTLRTRNHRDQISRSRGPRKILYSVFIPVTPRPPESEMASNRKCSWGSPYGTCYFFPEVLETFLYPVIEEYQFF